MATGPVWHVRLWDLRYSHANSPRGAFLIFYPGFANKLVVSKEDRISGKERFQPYKTT